MSRLGRVLSVVGCAVALIWLATPVHAGPEGMSSFDYSSLPEGCKPGWHGDVDGAQPPSREAMMQKLVEEFDLTGQQQMDLQTLVADYAERFKQMAEQMRASSEQLAETEPDDPYYWTLAQEVSAQAAASAGESVILLSELRQKVYQVLTVRTARRDQKPDRSPQGAVQTGQRRGKGLTISVIVISQ